MSSGTQSNADRGTRFPAGYLRTRGAHIVGKDGVLVRLAGVNWYGFDCDSMVPGGLDDMPLDDICRTVADLGFNSISPPFAARVARENPTARDGLTRNPDLVGRTALEVMDALIEAAGRHDLAIVLDSHRAEPGWSTQENGLWYTRTCPEQAWLDAWTLLARHRAPGSHTSSSTWRSWAFTGATGA